MYKICTNEQGSPQWHQDRLGKVTASTFSEVITKTGKRSASIERLINGCVAELITGYPDDMFVSGAMIRGTELEPEAFAYFNFSKDLNLSQCGFVNSIKENGEICLFGCSPDGINLVEKFGAEIKCPLAHTHVGYLAAGKIPDQYYAQVQGSMELMNLDRWFFGSYHPEFPALELFIERDKEYGAKLREYLEYAEIEIKLRVERIKNQMGAA